MTEARSTTTPRCPEGPTSLGFLLGKAHRAARRRFESRLVDLDLSAPQAAVLRTLALGPGVGVRGLARQLGTDPMNAWRLAESLIARELVSREHVPSDRRRRALCLTPQGLALATEVEARARAQDRELATMLGNEAYAALMHGLVAVLQSSELEYDDGSPDHADQ